MTRTADVIVVGAGIAGVGAAAHIAAEARVVVLEMEERPGYHTTSRSAAMFIASYGNETVRAVSAASHSELADPSNEVTGGSVLSRRGVLYLSGPDDPPLTGGFTLSEGVQQITPDEAVRLVPILRGGAIADAHLEPDASDIDVDRLFQGWLRQLRRNGGEVVINAQVRALDRRADAWRFDTAAGPFEAPVVINASGAWGDEIAGLAGLPPVGLTPTRRSAAILPAPDGHDLSGWPLFAGAAETWYAKPEAGKLLVSPADEDPVPPHDAFVDDMTLAEGLDRYERAVTVPVERVERSWAGLRTFSPDRTPVVGFEPGVDGFFWLVGQGGFGVQTAPALSRHAARLVTGRDFGEPLDDAVAKALAPDRLRVGE